MEQHHISQAYEIAAKTIKNAILQGQYEAAKGVNRIISAWVNMFRLTLDKECGGPVHWKL